MFCVWYDYFVVRLLPFILIPILIVAGLGFWRYLATKQNLTTPEVSQDTQNQSPIEVPKALPAVTVSPASTTPAPTGAPGVLDPKVAVLESAVTDLKTRVSALEKLTPPSSVSQAPLYIPVGASGGPWLYADFTSLNEYQVSINPDNYAGYTGMQLEVNFRLVGAPGTGYVRLYNATDKSAVASELSTTGTSFGVLTSAVFKLPGGQKLYTIQVKSTNSQDLYIQSARIKVNF